jgi:regulator of cell morphogenesis and NO signaling
MEDAPMENKSHRFSDALDPAEGEKFKLVVKRLKEEHNTMEESLSDLLAKANQLQINEGKASDLSLLQVIMSDVQLLMKDLERHEEWEEQHVFPITAEYFKLQMRPSISFSIWVLEKEHLIVKQCFQPFLDLSQKILIFAADPNLAGQLRLCAVYLIQGCSLLQEHFEMEEGLIYPLMDEILAAAD